MSYPKDVFGAAMDEMARRRDKARRIAAAHRDEIAHELPEADKLQRQLGSTSAKLAQAVLNGGEGIEGIRVANERAQELYRLQLKKAGYDTDYTQVKYSCPHCDDTGFVDGRTCTCLKKLLGELMMRRLGVEKSLEECSFDNFSLDFYPAQSENGGSSPAGVMRSNYMRCREWAENFSGSSPNLLFAGATGLGKTHLSMAIARTVIDRGYDVFYYPYGTLLTQLEAERFSRGGDYAGGIAPLLSCELLILDDLGSEFTSPFGQSLL